MAPDKPANWKKTLLICSLVLLAAAGLLVLIFSTEPQAARGGATKRTAMLVEVSVTQRGSFRPTIVATGTVKPQQDVQLSPRVSGLIIERTAEFEPGAFVEKGQQLLRIDPADYRTQLRQRQSELSQALAALEIEMGLQSVAEHEQELLDGTRSEQDQALILRKPQLKTAQVRAEAARAALQQAKLALQRTRVKAPFTAQVLSREVNVGSQVSPGDTLGHLVGVERYWVTISVPLAKLRWLDFSGEAGGEGSPVKLRNQTAWPKGVYRMGRVDRLLGALDEQTRLARVLVTVDDPLVRQADAGAGPPLMVGEFLQAHILGKPLKNVVRLHRDHVRDGDTVWVMQAGQLSIRDVEVVFRDQQHAYISSGLREGDRVVTTNLSTVSEGAKLRLRGTAEP